MLAIDGAQPTGGRPEPTLETNQQVMWWLFGDDREPMGLEVAECDGLRRAPAQLHWSSTARACDRAWKGAQEQERADDRGTPEIGDANRRPSGRHGRANLRFMTLEDVVGREPAIDERGGGVRRRGRMHDGSFALNASRRQADRSPGGVGESPPRRELAPDGANQLLGGERLCEEHGVE